MQMVIFLVLLPILGNASQIGDTISQRLTDFLNKGVGVQEYQVSATTIGLSVV